MFILYAFFVILLVLLLKLTFFGNPGVSPKSPGPARGDLVLVKLGHSPGIRRVYRRRCGNRWYYYDLDGYLLDPLVDVWLYEIIHEDVSWDCVGNVVSPYTIPCEPDLGLYDEQEEYDSLPPNVPQDDILPVSAAAAFSYDVQPVVECYEPEPSSSSDYDSDFGSGGYSFDD